MCRFCFGLVGPFSCFTEVNYICTFMLLLSRRIFKTFISDTPLIYSKGQHHAMYSIDIFTLCFDSIDLTFKAFLFTN